MKFSLQTADQINGIDICSRAFDQNAWKHNKEFKTLFTVQDPHKVVLLATKHPNFKVDPFLHLIPVVSMESFNLGEFVSIDEQTIAFKGRHIDKLRIGYKKEGDGLQSNSICCDWYPYSFFHDKYTSSKEKTW